MKQIAIMRPASYLAESIKLATSLGFDPVAAPFIDVVDRKDSNFKAFLNRVMKGESDYVIFTSANGVEFTLLKLKDPEEFIEHLNKTIVVAIGPKTQDALQKSGIRVSMVPESYSSQGIVEKLSGIEGSVIEIARSTHGTPDLVNGLLKKGAVVYETQVYQIISPKDERHEKLMRRALSGDVDIFSFTSSMMVKNFIALAEKMGIRDEMIRIMNEKTVAAIGKPTSEILEKLGIIVKVMPLNYTFEELLLECKKHDC